LCWDNPGRPVPEETLCLLPYHRAVLHSGCVSPLPVFWIFMEQGKIMEAEVPTVWVGATPTGLTAPRPHNPQGFLQVGCPSCRPTNSVKALKALINEVNQHWAQIVPGWVTIFGQINDIGMQSSN